MTTMSDLSEDLVGEVLSRVPLTSLSAVRSSYKKWNALSENQIVGKKAAATTNQFLGFILMDCKVWSMKVDLQGIRNHGELIDLSIKQVSILNQIEVEICKILHCDGLLLCLIKDKRWRVVWNPYLGQTRWIQPIKSSHKFHPEDGYAFGYDNNRNHKILRFFDLKGFEIYDFNSNSWRVLDLNPNCDISPGCHIRSGVSLKGNAYFFSRKKPKNIASKVEVFLLCFDFTAERFRRRLHLPFRSYNSIQNVILSCVRDEQLAVLYQHSGMMEIWITNKIEPDVVSWSSFLKVDTISLLPHGFRAGTFFIDEEKKVAVVSDFHKHRPTITSPYQTLCIFGEDGYFKSVNIREARNPDQFGFYNQLEFSCYVPSLVQLQINQQGIKRKERDY